jgi:rubredoxin
LPVNDNSGRGMLMERYRCSTCGWVYDEENGYPEGGIAPKTPFFDLPSSWICPFCHQDKAQFVRVDDRPPKEGRIAARVRSEPPENNR